MKRYFLRILAGTMLAACLVFYGTVADAAPTTKMLQEDTKLVPAGVMSLTEIPVFKKGTTVTLNENGEVLEGTLASDPWLNCVALKYEEDGKHYFRRYGYVFREGSRVWFSEKGEVVRGTFSHNHGTPIVVPISGRSSVMLRPLTEVTFHNNGVLATGTINTFNNATYVKAYLRPVGWQRFKELTDNPGGFVDFKGGTLIELNDKGEVIKGTLTKDTKLLSPTGAVRVYDAGTTVEFDDKGAVVKAAIR